MKYFITDLDGTILKNGILMKENLKKINLLKEEGYKIILATGRSLGSTMPYANQVNPDYVLASNGALVYDYKKEQTISVDTIRKEDVQLLVSIAKDEEVPLIVHGLDKSYIVGDTKVLESLDFEFNSIQSIDEIKGDIIKLTFLMKSHQKYIEELIEKIKEIDDFECVNPGAPSVDVMNKGTNKWSGANHIINKDDYVVAIGDAENDIEMIVGANLGIAMGQGHKKVRDSADYVTTTEEDFGFIKAIKYILEI